MKKMKKEIMLYDKNIKYQLRESARARCLRITIHPGGELSATLPSGLKLEQLENFIRQKADWILEKLRSPKRKRLLAVGNRSDYLKHKNTARCFIENRIACLNFAYNFNYKKISIRNQRSRWGSCSQKGNLNFNYKIIHLPEELADYIIVHELCHLKEFNHSKRFWNLVGIAIPKHRSLRQKLREY